MNETIITVKALADRLAHCYSPEDYGSRYAKFDEDLLDIIM